MSITKLGKGLVMAASATLLFACASSEQDDSQSVAPVVTETVVQEVAPPAKTPEQLAEEANTEARQARTVYFDFDDDTLKADGRALLEAHAWFLAKNPNVVVTVDGHADERGTPAYNLALGERRAKAVGQFLMLNGVSSSQIQTRSYGEEKPAVEGHDESAWSMNRRGELNYEG